MRSCLVKFGSSEVALIKVKEKTCQEISILLVIMMLILYKYKYPLQYYPDVVFGLDA